MEYIGLDTLMGRLSRHPMLENITLETVAEYTADFIKIHGIPDSLREKTAIVKIEEYKGALPCDFYEINQVRDIKYNRGRYYRGSTDSFHFSYFKCDNDYTYKIQGSCIFTSTQNTEIEISYKAFISDSEGIPMIPDNSIYLRALESYIKLQYFTILFDMGKLPSAVFSNARQQYAFNAGQVQSTLRMPTLDQMESLTNMLTKFLPEAVRNHSSGFKNTSKKEFYKNH